VLRHIGVFGTDVVDVAVTVAMGHIPLVVDMVKAAPLHMAVLVTVLVGGHVVGVPEEPPDIVVVAGPGV
jgi:hypothetical protein